MATTIITKQEDIQFKKVVKSESHRVFDFFITGYIECITKKDSGEKLKVLKDIVDISTEKDILHLTLNTYGGALNTTSGYLSLLSEFKGKINIKISGALISAGAVIYNGIITKKPDITINDTTAVMIHKASYIAWGNENQIKEEIKSSSLICKMVDKSIVRLLSKKQKKKYNEGKDVWIKAEKLVKKTKKLYPEINITFNQYGE